MVEINLLPWREQLQLKRQAQVYIQIGYAFAAALSLILLAHLFLAQQLPSIQLSLAHLQASLTKVNQDIEKVRAVYQVLDDEPLPELDLNAISRQQQEVLTGLQRLVTLMPATVYARQIHFEHQAWVIDGVASALGDLLQFNEKLKKELHQEINAEAAKKGRQLTIQQKAALFHFQLRFE